MVEGETTMADPKRVETKYMDAMCHGLAIKNKQKRLWGVISY